MKTAQRRKAANLCRDCVGPIDIDGRVGCSSCAGVVNKANNDRYISRRLAGLCTNCPEVAISGTTQCVTCTAKGRLYARNHKEQRLEGLLSRKYGITSEDKNRMIQTQDNKCAVCCVEFGSPNSRTAPTVDHDHETGRIRGLLCSRCNQVEGKLKDLDLIEWATRMTVYLNEV